MRGRGIGRRARLRARGGGVYLKDSGARLSSCRVAGNTSDGTGGGVAVDGGAPVLENVAVAGNQAYAALCSWETTGGGLSAMNGAEPSLVNSTLAGNWSTETSGVYAQEGFNTPCAGVTLYNTVLGRNAAGDVTGYVSASYTLCEDLDSGENTAGLASAPLFGRSAPGTWTAAAQYNATTDRTVLTDSAASFTADALAGRLLVLEAPNPPIGSRMWRCCRTRKRR